MASEQDILTVAHNRIRFAVTPYSREHEDMCPLKFG